MTFHRVASCAASIPIVLPLAVLLSATVCTGQNSTEISAVEESPTFSAGVNLVSVPVVVRDKKHEAIGTLKKEDFLVFDNGKSQTITRFSVEHPKTGTGASAKSSPGAGSSVTEPAGKKTVEIADRFVAFVFDDLNLEMSDLLPVRKVLTSFLDQADANTRFAISTTSGLNTVDFTNEAEALRKALNGIIPRSRRESRTQSCPPPVSYYTADQIVNRDDTMALTAITGQVTLCECPNGGRACTTTMMHAEARSLTHQALSIGEVERRTTWAC